MSLPRNDPRHGTVNGYRYCQCARCRAAKVAARREWKLKTEPLPPGDHRHGTVNGYQNWDCRCDLCRVAWNAFMRDYRRRTKSRDGARS